MPPVTGGGHMAVEAIAGTDRTFSGFLRIAETIGKEFKLESEQVLSVVRRFIELRRLDDRGAGKAERRRAVIDGARQSVNSNAPTAERLKHAGRQDGERLVEEGEVYGDKHQRREVAVLQDPITFMRSRRMLTQRQLNAAEMFREDWDLGIVGIRDVEQVKVSGGQRAGYSEAQLLAAASFAGAKQRLGPMFIGIVECVVLQDETIEEVAIRRISGEDGTVDRQQLRNEKERLLWLLRGGLDLVGDAYWLQAEIQTERVDIPGPGNTTHMLRIQYRHEADGTISAISLAGRAWMTTAATIGELRAKAAAASAAAAA